MSTPPSRTTLPHDWRIDRGAVVVCDMSDAHHRVSAARRVAEMAPRINEVLGALRARRALPVRRR